MFFSVPLPHVKDKTFEVKVVFQTRAPIIYGVTVPKTGTVNVRGFFFFFFSNPYHPLRVLQTFRMVS
jgi:hypothetical protein